MRPAYVAASIALLLFSLASSAQQAQLSQNNNINQSINQTAGYIQSVNDSSYLIFEPNLTQAYRYLGEAQNVSTSNPAQALALLGEAKQSAQQQLQYLNSRRNGAFLSLAVLTIVLIGVLYYVMRPPRRKRS